MIYVSTEKIKLLGGHDATKTGKEFISLQNTYLKDKDAIGPKE